MTDTPDLLGSISPFDRVLGLRVTSAGPDEVVAELPVTEGLLQAHGILHGGVYCAAVETVTSVGATLQVGLDERVVGMGNHTRFLRAVTGGSLTVRATPESRDGQVLVWAARVTDEDGRLVAEGLVTLFHLDRAAPRPGAVTGTTVEA